MCVDFTRGRDGFCLVCAAPIRVIDTEELGLLRV